MSLSLGCKGLSVEGKEDSALRWKQRLDSLVYPRRFLSPVAFKTSSFSTSRLVQAKDFDNFTLRSSPYWRRVAVFNFVILSDCQGPRIPFLSSQLSFPFEHLVADQSLPKPPEQFGTVPVHQGRKDV